MLNEELYIRQTAIIDPAKLTQKIAIIGAGSIGGWTALCLGKLGCQDITIFDFDNVELHNAGSQIYKASDEGDSKVDALASRLSFLLEEPIKTEKIKWTKEVDLKNFDIVIAAVDNITARKEIFEHLQGADLLYIDARMASNSIEIYTTQMKYPIGFKNYYKTLFEEADTLPIPCSERAVVYNVFIVAGLIGDLIAKNANKLDLPPELIVDLYNFNLYQ